MIIKNISGKLIGINGELVLPDDSVTVDDSFATLPSIMVMAHAKMVELIPEQTAQSVKEKKAEPVVAEPEPVAEEVVEEAAPEVKDEPAKEETVKAEEPSPKKTTSAAKKKTTTTKKTTAKAN